MAKNKNHKQPLTKSQLLENSANGFAVLQGLRDFVFPTLLALSATSLHPQLATPTQSTPPKTEIHIYQRPGSETTIKIEQVQNKLNQLTESEDKETLSKAREAIWDLQKLLTEKKAELEQGKTQLVQEDTQNLNPEQRKVKAEIDNYLPRVDDEIAKLEEIKQRIQASQEAIDWLNPEQEQKFLFALASYAGDAAFAAHPELNNLLGATDADNMKLQFYFDIKNFLTLIHTCLIACRPNILDEHLDEKKLPLAPLPRTAYVSAFEFIRDQKVPNAISGEAATELIAYLDYLIKALQGMELARN